MNRMEVAYVADKEVAYVAYEVAFLGYMICVSSRKPND